MMYKSKLAVAVKSEGKILREFEDKVYLPFGSEYSLYFRNLNSTRVLVNISIDGNLISGSGGIIINANDTIDIERSLANNNLSAGNRFKFIERSASVEQHRGIGVEDGLIRIEFQFEKPRAPIAFDQWNHGDPWNNGYNGRRLGGNNVGPYRGIIGASMDGVYSVKSTEAFSANTTDASNDREVKCCSGIAANQVGVTVPGSVSTQKFYGTVLGELEQEKHVIVLQLFGETSTGTVVDIPVTVKTKPTCTSCGKLNKATAKFCSNCGTGLVII